MSNLIKTGIARITLQSPVSILKPNMNTYEAIFLTIVLSTETVDGVILRF